MSGATSFHMRLDIRGCLSLGRRECAGWAKSATVEGRKPTTDQFINYLQGQLLRGTFYLPIGECDQWDPKDGCQGHPVEDRYGEKPGAV